MYVYFHSNRLQVYKGVRKDIDTSKREINLKLGVIRLDGTGECKGEIRRDLEEIDGITLNYCPKYVFKSNGAALRFVRELYLRARI